MKAQFLARGKKEHKNQKANDYNKLQSLQNGLVCDVSSAFDLLAALRLHAPNKQIPFISALRIRFRFGCGYPTQSNHQAGNLAKLWQEFYP